MKGIQAVLFDLPIYSSEECANVDCSRPAVIRHPETGRFYCAGDAWQLTQSHKAHMEDLSTVISIRAFLLKNKAECEFCDKPAERVCNGCMACICFDHFTLVPRTGCACPECGEALEQEASA